MKVEFAWRALALAALLALQAMLQPASAQVPPGRIGGPQWHRQWHRWQRLPARRRQAILRAQQRYRRLSPAEQRRLYEQYRRRRR
jgi:hypothetical protein